MDIDDFFEELHDIPYGYGTEDWEWMLRELLQTLEASLYGDGWSDGVEYGKELSR